MKIKVKAKGVYIDLYLNDNHITFCSISESFMVIDTVTRTNICIYKGENKEYEESQSLYYLVSDDDFEKIKNLYS